jgi:hypothetical protein
MAVGPDTDGKAVGSDHSTTCGSKLPLPPSSQVDGRFNGCMVDRWLRTPFKAQHLPPGFTRAMVDAFVAGRNLATSALLKRAKEAGVYLVGEVGGESAAETVDAVSDPGYFNGYLPLVAQLRLAKEGIGLLASYKPGGTGAALNTTLAKFLVGAASGS